MEFVKFFIDNWSEILNAVVGILSALVVLFMLIPGQQPEAFLQKVVEFLKKFSRK